MSLTKRTTAALGHELMERLTSMSFCIVGCGGTGANFAEMLVRTGAKRLTLIDGGTVKKSALNRVFCFQEKDIGMPKVKALETHLRSVARQDLDLCALHDSFRRPDQLLDDNVVGQRVRDAVHDADVVFAATDTNTSRLAIEDLCREKAGGTLLCCGVRVDRAAGIYEYECAWSPRTPKDQAEVEGYGPENASFAAIVLEATSVSFTMLLSHLCRGHSAFRRYRRKYDAHFIPVATLVD